MMQSRYETGPSIIFREPLSQSGVVLSDEAAGDIKNKVIRSR